MLILTTTSDALRVKLSATVATNQLQCVCAYRDTTATDITPGKQLAETNNTTLTDMVSAPASSTQRIVEYVSVFNRDTASAEVTVSLYNGTTDYTIFKCTLAAGEKLEYQHGSGWQVFTTAGSLKQSLNQGAAPVTSTLNQTILSSNVVNSNVVANTLEDVTGLSISVTAGSKYYFRFFVAYSVGASTTGARYALNGPAISEMSYWYGIPTSATARTLGNYSTYSNPAASTTASGGTLNLVILEGYASFSANGTLQLQHASELSLTSVTTLAGYSFVEWRQLA